MRDRLRTQTVYLAAQTGVKNFLQVAACSREAPQKEWKTSAKGNGFGSLCVNS